jgi:hypothetical protein
MSRSVNDSFPRQGHNIKTVLTAFLMVMLIGQSTPAQTENWLKIITRTSVAVKYFAPLKSASFTRLSTTGSREDSYSIVKQFADDRIQVTLTFRKYDTHVELCGEAWHAGNEDVCFTLKVILPSNDLRNVTWSHDLDSTVAVGAKDTLASNYVDASTVIPPAGAFNSDEDHNGGYGDKVGTGQMSFYPLASITAGDIGLAWGVDMGIPIVFRLAYDASSGMIAEYDVAMVKETKQFPGRAYFKLHLFEFDPVWNMRAALEKYYTIQPEYFKKRVPQEGIWLPFAPLLEIRDWQDFGFAFHETNFHSKDRGLKTPLSAIEAGKVANVLTFQYTEPWEEEIPIGKLNLTYEQISGKETLPEEHAEYLRTSAALDKENKLIARKLETPWFSSGWALSINTNTDPDIKGFNRYDYVCKREIRPAVAMNVDGIYFDCLEWHWHYDLNYNRSHFEYTDYPLTFSSSLEVPRPAIWCYSSDYKFVSKVADEMHRAGKYVMGNSFCWIPFAAGALDVFGSELSWYIPADMKMARFQFARALARQKPVVFLLNEGMDDTVFAQPPYGGYRTYFEKMLFYGFFPSFFSVNATSHIYWADSAKYSQGRPFFKKYIPLIKIISEAGWQPVTFARLSNPGVRIERFGAAGDNSIYFTLYNPNAEYAHTVVTVDAQALKLTGVLSIEELIDGQKPEYERSGAILKVPLNVKGAGARLIKITKH